MRNAPTALALVAVIVVACGGGGPTPAPGASPNPASQTPGTQRQTTSPTSPGATQSPVKPATDPPTSFRPASILPATASPQTVTPEAEPVGWREIAVSGGPSAREDHTWTVDGDGERAYLFGGRGAGDASNELWVYELATDTWTQLETTAGGPAPRFGHTATWVPEIGLVVWGGQRGRGFFGDMWAFDPGAAAWQQLPLRGAVPPGRYGACASLGPDGQLWVSHGFTDTGRFSDTRSYDFASGTWTDRTPVDRVPLERCLHDCFWSDAGQLVLYAGQTNGVAALNDVWAYDPRSGTWTRGADPPAPARQLYALAVTSGSGIVFGGGSADGAFLGDSWTIDAATLAMTPIPVEAGPRPRAGATLISDSVRGRLVLFGGKHADGTLSDVWELHLAPEVAVR